MAIENINAELKLMDELKVEGRARNFKLTMDQAKEAGGNNEGLCPGEVFLNALGGCKCMVARTLSESANIKLKELYIKMEGEMDSDGFSGKNKNAKIGFSSIKTKYLISADNTEDEIKNFINTIEAKCPMQDTIVNDPKLDYEINIM
ncbi:OsmC family protein [Anaerocolumna sp.]|uniref:OsmC family protein n=1 Tax=Anaerocolumna sp. TaxID=2041569 RepID=UPI0028ABBE4C|nr:OsmC family protein [Anaerocolumna sp.]